ncbi:MAG: peptide ABC transporter substrate-binding protein [Opitutus sp.]|nr:peptide ABC transporter substrate-binding protein [Opitutus sp.]
MSRSRRESEVGRGLRSAPSAPAAKGLAALPLRRPPSVLRLLPVLWLLPSVLWLLPACSKQDTAIPASAEKLLRLSQRNEPATLDPHLATLPDEFFVARALLEGLTAPNPAEGPPLPGVASRWEASPDGLRWTFHLRPDAKWSNGDAVTARDFLFSFQRALTPALAAPKAQLFLPVKNAAAFYRGTLADFAQVGFSAPDDHTLVVALEKPCAYLPALAASGAWLPVHRATLEKSGGAAARDGAWTRPGRFVGNGPFVLTEWRKDQHLAAIPNPHYHSAARVRVRGLRFQVYDSGDTEERAFRAGQVDVTLAVPFTKLGAYAPPILRRQPLHETRYFALNTTRPPLDDTRVRQALSLALDRSALVASVLRGGQQAALNFVPPGLGGYSGEPRLHEDSAAARRLLAAAGFPEGRGFPRLELSAWGVNPATLEAVQQMWRRGLGIETAIVQREGKVHMASVLAGDFAIALMPAIPDYDDPSALFNEWLGDAPGNFSRWANGRFDRLVREAGRTPDTARRNTLYREAEAILLAELPMLPLYFNAQDYLLTPRVRGWRQDALWNRFYLDVTLSNERPAPTRRLRAQN